MAYVNVKDWSVEQVTDWLKGLDNVILPYAKSFLNNGVTGHQLLNLRVDDLEHIGVTTLGHQEIILEAVEHIRNFHYELDKENLQMLALRLSCAANSLNRELQFDENSTTVQTQTLSDVHNIITTIKPLVCWLDRSPFAGDKDYNEMKRNLLQLGFEMATTAHRDKFSQRPVQTIQEISEKLSKLADKIIQEFSDPMILQPATLDLTTLKKKEQEVGFFILPSNNAVHQIAEIKYGSPAHISTKIEEGDEIVQVNYQTVVGWQRKKVVLLLQESPPEIVLTLKKRPRHTKVYGQIYMKPYRLPSKKRAAPYSRWNENLPSPRLLTIHDLPPISLLKTPANVEVAELDTESSSGSDSEPPDSPLDNTRRLCPLKPRSVLQRRNTITGATPTITGTSHAVEQYWKLLKNRAASAHSSSYNLPTEKFDDGTPYIRDKSASCSHGLELSQRPTTVIGIAHGRKNSFKTPDFAEKSKKVNFDDTKIIINEDNAEKKTVSTTSLSSLKDEVIEFIDEGEDLQDRSRMAQEEKPPPEVAPKEPEPKKPAKPPLKDAVLEDVRVDSIIKRFDKEAEKPRVLPRTFARAPAVPQKPSALPRSNRGKLDKSHSTPAYDLSADEESPPVKYELGIPVLHDVTYNPPVIESRKKPADVPPKPPPRTNPPESYKRRPLPEIGVDVEKKADGDGHVVFEPPAVSTPVSKQFREETGGVLKVDTHAKSPAVVEANKKTSPTSLVVRAIYSSKSKSGKKKNSLIAKKRKVSVNDVSPGEVSGYLHQRLRSRHNQNVHWEKRWFVLNQNCLYGFKSKESTKAECYIYLAGFTVTVATEVKSRSNAFKVYHTGTVFYFSAENEETLTSWLEMISAATFNTDPSNSADRITYSETDDDSDSETSSTATKSSTLEKPADGIRKFNSLKKFTSKKRSDNSVSGSTSLDRKWFFNKSNSQVPVPTAQFRSYRKIPASTTIGNFTSHIPNFASKLEIPVLQNSVESIPSAVQVQEIESYPKPKLLNQLHASNPSLCNVEYNAFQFHHLPRPKCNDNNVTGFVTLKELMNSEGDDRRADDGDAIINPSLIRPDVVYGEVPIRPEHRKKTHARTSSDCSEPKKDSSCFGKRSSSIKSGNHSFTKGKSNGSLRFDLAKQKSNSSKSLSKNKERSYEMIYCPQSTTTDVHFAQNRTLDGRIYHHETPKKGGSLKPAVQYTPMALPLASDERLKFNSRYAFELNLDEKSGRGGKFKQFFMKQDGKKEKKSTASPKLPKASFLSEDNDISWPTQMMDSYMSPSTDSSLPLPMKNSPPPADYPGLEYPPVFEPETYSLANPHGTIFRKQSKKN